MAHRTPPASPADARRGVAVAGHWAVTRTRTLDRWPAPGATATVVSQTEDFGGGACNVLTNLAALRPDFPLAAIGTLGNDPNGRALLAHCQARGITIAQLRPLPDATTAVTDYLRLADGSTNGHMDNRSPAALHWPGASALLTRDHFDWAADDCKLLLMSEVTRLPRLSWLDNAGQCEAAAVLNAARQRGSVTALTLGGTENPRWDALVRTLRPDWLLLEEAEAERLANCPPARHQRPDVPRAKKLARKASEPGGTEWTFVRLGWGAVGYQRSTRKWAAQGSVTVPPESVVYPTGDFDALVAGILYGLHQHWTPQECLRLGVCAAAACGTHPTHCGGVLPHNQALALGEQWGFRRL